MVMRLEEKINRNRSWSEKLADALTSSFGTVEFLLVNTVFFILWLLVNLGFLPGVAPFDRFPFGLLTMIVSLEAIFLSVIVLISQNRSSKVASLRQELDFIVNIQAEEEITRILNMLDEIHDHLGLDPHDDKELARMKHKTDINRLRETLMRGL